MMRALMLIPVAASLAACGYSQDHFTRDYTDAICDWTMECYSDVYAEVDQCIADATTGADFTRCDYDPKEAKACVDAVEGMACPAEEEFPEFPVACENAFECQPADTGDTAE